MFSPKTDRIVDSLALEEFENAVILWGRDYDSYETACEVLQEELEEVNAEICRISEGPLDAYQNIRYARNAIKELAQVIAVCMKITQSPFFKSLSKYGTNESIDGSDSRNRGVDYPYNGTGEDLDEVRRDEEGS